MSSSTVEQIKERLSITDVVESYVKLGRAGSSIKALCPFHSEKTPSFIVSPVRGTFHCFGCGKGGDIFTFVQEIEGLPFSGALKLLAERAGVELSSYDKKEHSEKELLYAVLETATRFFEEKLAQNQKAIEYLLSRKIDKNTIALFRIGYAPNEWRVAYDFLKKQGFSDGVIEKAGLIIPNPKGYYDRFRGRIMFPIFDYSGRIIAFSGRVFDSEESHGGKYVNSPATPLYDKSHALYGYDKAKTEMKKTNTCILVEGQVDLILSHQAGFSNTVAVSGTALTVNHLQAIRRFADTVVFAFDADQAGIGALERGMMHALEFGMDSKVVALPDGSDPADVIGRDVSLWRTLVGEAKHVVDFYLALFQREHKEERTLRASIERRVIPYLARIKSSIDRAQFVAKIARLLGVGEEPVWEEVRRAAAGFKKEPLDEAGIKKPQAGALRRAKIERKLLGIIFWQESSNDAMIETSKMKDAYRRIVGEDRYAGAIALDTAKKNEYIFEAEQLTPEPEEHALKKEVEELLVNLELACLAEARERVALLLRRAEREQSPLQAEDLLKEYQRLTTRIEALISDVERVK
ncbi:MAG: DNA primase [Candidatus Lloydbacteria bacterium]|nr:DNA primase [Candidatus Lloydbacteria bacterium]